MKKSAFLTTVSILAAGMLYSQSDSTGSIKKYIPSIGAHVGALSYLGDIEGAEGTTLYTYGRPAYGFYLEKRIGSIFGVSLNGMFGKVSKSQLDERVFQNFESSITNFDLNVLFDFDNGKIINETSLFSPFVSFGFGFLSFDPKGDLSANGNTYNYWDDGTLRDVAQSVPGADTTANIVLRDFEYETSLKDSTVNYSKTSFTVPIRLGLKFKLSQHIDARIAASYILTFTDYIDNISSGGNDKLFYTSFGVHYNFAPRVDEDDKYRNFDFSDLDNEDSDGDGVVDNRDMCQNTPKDITVDEQGCPLDGDEDGVPDYLDKEKNTVPGALINAEGVTITDAMIADQEKMKDSVETKYTLFKAEDLSQDEIDEILRLYEDAGNTLVKRAKIPLKFQPLDLNYDNYISAKEVTGGIDAFFDGGNDLTAKDLEALVQFYFDQ